MSLKSLDPGIRRDDRKDMNQRFPAEVLEYYEGFLRHEPDKLL